MENEDTKDIKENEEIKEEKKEENEDNIEEKKEETYCNTYYCCCFSYAGVDMS